MKELISAEIERLTKETEKLYEVIALLEKRETDTKKQLDISRENFYTLSGQITGLNRVLKTIEQEELKNSEEKNTVKNE